MNFAEYAVATAPPWLQGPEGQKLLKVLGRSLDDVLSEYKEAVKVRLTTGPDDALPHHGEARRIQRGPADSVDQYRQKLTGAWETWRWSGTDKGVETALAHIDLDAVVVDNNDWFPGPPDGDADWWSRIWIVVFADRWAAWQVGDGHTIGESGLTVGSTASAAEVESVKSAAISRKASHALCVNVVIVFGMTKNQWTHGDLAGLPSSSAWWPVNL